MEDKKVIVTGGAGFIGSHLVDSLIEKNRVKVIDNLSFGKKKNVNEKANLEKVDIRDFQETKSILENTDFIFHLAATATTKESNMGWNNPELDCDVNLKGTINLLKACEELEIYPKFVYASTAAVYGDIQYTPIDEEHPTNPISPYGIDKLASEKYIQAFHKEKDFETTILRIFNVYGPRQPRYVMYDFLKKLQNNNDRLEVLGSGEQARTYCYVSDAVKGIIKAAEEGKNGSIYNLAGDSLISIGELAELMVKLLELDAKIEYTGESWTGDIKTLEADNSKIKEDLGFKPSIGLEEGLRKFIRYFEDHEGSITD